MPWARVVRPEGGRAMNLLTKIFPRQAQTMQMAVEGGTVDTKQTGSGGDIPLRPDKSLLETGAIGRCVFVA